MCGSLLPATRLSFVGLHDNVRVRSSSERDVDVCVPSLPEPAGASAKPPTRSTSRPQLSKTPSEIRRSAIRIRVGGGTQYIEDPRSIEEAESNSSARRCQGRRHVGQAAGSPVEAALCRRQGDHRREGRLAADFEAEIQMLTSSHRNEVQMLTAQLEASEAAKRQALRCSSSSSRRSRRSSGSAQHRRRRRRVKDTKKGTEPSVRHASVPRRRCETAGRADGGRAGLQQRLDEALALVPRRSPRNSPRPNASGPRRCAQRAPCRKSSSSGAASGRGEPRRRRRRWQRTERGGGRKGVGGGQGSGGRRQGQRSRAS